MASVFPRSTAARCATCGSRLRADRQCAVCLLRGALDNADNVDGSDLLFGHFEIKRRADGSAWELGRGSMGVTYLAFDRVLSREVALKIIELPAAARASDVVRQRFLHEARTTAALRHPNVAPVFEFGAVPEKSRCFYAMELVEGDTLAARVRREGPLDAGTVLEIAVQVTRALIAAADREVIHRDLKPGNLMLAQDKATGDLEVKVIDFGLAKAIAEADPADRGFVGTPGFASPEQMASRPVDARTDIYSLGATLWFALTGQAPRTGNSIGEKQSRDDLPIQQLVTREVPAPLIQLLRSMLARDSAERPESPRQLMEVLRSCQKRIERRRFNRIAFPVGIFALAASALFLLQRHWQENRSSVPEKSIAVLPLENLSSEKQNEFFADGIHEELLSELARVKDLKVISRVSVMPYRNRVPRNAREIAQQLGVTHIVEGSVERAGDRVRVSIELISARDDRHLWTESYDRTLIDSLTLQGELATEIAGAIGARLSSQEKTRLTSRLTNHPAAYDAYLRGRAAAPGGWWYLLEGDSENEIRFYQEAVKLDPRFALAWAHLSIAQSRSQGLGPSKTSQRWKEAQESLDRALALDPDLPEVHLARAYHETDRSRALREFREAEKGLPNNVDVLNSIALAEKRAGHFDESITVLQRAVELDPRNLDTVNHLALTEGDVRRFPEALATVERALAWARDNPRLLLTKAELLLSTGALAEAKKLLANPALPADWRAHCAFLERDYRAAMDLEKSQSSPAALLDLGLSQELAGDRSATVTTYRQAAEELQAKLRDLAPGSFEEANTRALLGETYANLGETRPAIAEAEHAMSLQAALRSPYGGAVIGSEVAEIYSRLGDADHAVPLLQKLLDLPCGFSITAPLLRLNPVWDPIRTDPRFQALSRENKPKKS